MSLQEKMIGSLIDPKSIKKEDFSSKLFCGLYNVNINNPYLDNHIFLLFKYDLSAESINRDYRFLKSPILNLSEFITIKNENYVLYTFCIMDHNIRNIIDNNMCIDTKTLLGIYKFWNFEDDDINNYIVDQKINSLFEDLYVPEYDYQATFEDIFKKKKAGISIEKPAF